MTLYPAYLYSGGGWQLTVIEGQVTTTAHQLGPMVKVTVEGITAEKKQVHVVEQLARNNEVIAIQLQETHCTDPDSIAIARNVGTRSKKK